MTINSLSHTRWKCKYHIVAINSIIKKLSVHDYNIEDILDAENQDLTTSQLSKKLPGFSRRQIDIIDEILSTLPKSPENHMKDQKQTNKTEIPLWDEMIKLLENTTTIRDFFEVIKQALLSFEISNKQIHTMKEDFVNYLLKWGEPQHRSGLSRMLLKISKYIKNG